MNYKEVKVGIESTMTSDVPLSKAEALKAEGNNSFQSIAHYSF